MKKNKKDELNRITNKIIKNNNQYNKVQSIISNYETPIKIKIWYYYWYYILFMCKKIYLN
jgi:hypothetical protein